MMVLAGCHSRFQKRVQNIDQVRVAITTPAPIDIELGRMHSADPRLDPINDAYNLEIWIHETELESIVSNKVDPTAISGAFQYGIRERLGGGPPFAAVDDAPHVLDIQVVDWGLTVIGWRLPAAFSYRVRVVGFAPDGKVFYRSNFRCYGDAGPIRWLQTSLSSGTEAVEKLDPLVVQQSFDKAANLCGQQFADRLRLHSGTP